MSKNNSNDRSDNWGKELSILDDDTNPKKSPEQSKPQDSKEDPAESKESQEEEEQGQTRFNLHIDNPIGRRFHALGKMSSKSSINSLAQEAFRRYLDNLPEDKIKALDAFAEFND